MAVWHAEVNWLIVGDVWQMQEFQPDKCCCSSGIGVIFCSSFHDFFAVATFNLRSGSIEGHLVQFSRLL